MGAIGFFGLAVLSGLVLEAWLEDVDIRYRISLIYCAFYDKKITVNALSDRYGSALSDPN